MNKIVVLASLFVSLTAIAQQIGSNVLPDQDSSYTLSVKTQLVTEAVVVRDRSGKLIPNLTANDFTISEDGTAQRIRVFDHESLPVDGEPLPNQSPEEEKMKIYKRLARTSYRQATKYKNKRLIAMYFDMTAMRPDEQLRALQAAMKFVRTQMTAVDVVSILRYNGGSVDVLLDFSVDRNQMLSILGTMIVGEGQGNEERVDDSSSADVGAAFGQDTAEFNIFNTDRQLAALQTAANMLGVMSERKILLYFAGGLRLNGNDNQAQLHATVEAAVKAGVSFWPVDARGLVSSPPLGDAAQGSPGDQGMYSGASAEASDDRFQQSQDTLYSLAAETGGKPFFDNNDLDAGIVRAQHAVSDYYLIGYYSTNTAQNGAFRRIKVTTADTLNASLDYRRGYYANKEFGKFNGAEKERQLEDALLLGEPITELKIAMEVDYFQLNHAEYYVPVTVKIPGHELALARKFSADHTVIDFVCEIKDEVGGNTVTNLRDNVDVKLSGASAAELNKRPIAYSTGVTLLPGRYIIKFLARDDETGRIGTYETSFVIPNLNKETGLLAISSVVLSEHRVDARAALFNTMNSKEQAKNAAVDPLVNASGKMVPSVTRVFRSDRNLEILLQAYQGSAPEGSATPAPRTPMVAYATLFREGKQVAETPLVKVEALQDSRIGATTILLAVPLAGLAPGQYETQVTVLDPGSTRFATWRGTMAIVP